ncbi:major facilitator superfamily domain-containing protein [Trichoderma camerunense]
MDDPTRSALGTVQIRNSSTNQIILIPTPSQDPNDPLNWSKFRRYYIAITACVAMFLCTFLASGPSVALPQMAQDFLGHSTLTPPQRIAKTAYFITTVTLMQGVGCLAWIPLIIKYGRRPVYIAAFTLYTITAIWAAVADSYAKHLAARIVMGFAIGAGECLAPVTIADVTFLHERGVLMAVYTASISGGVAGGIIVSGLITIDHGWRTIYYVSIALIGAMTVVLCFTMPETSYIRNPVQAETASAVSPLDKEGSTDYTENADFREQGIPKKRTYLQELRLFHGKFTEEPLFKIFVRPIGLLILPPVLWATLVTSVLIGFLVAVSSTFSTAFGQVYKFEPYQSGLCFISALIGSLVGIAVGGKFTEVVADYFTKRNGGVREPEMRIPAIIISVVAAPTALVLYGVGIQNRLHWMVPTIGLALLNFSIVQAVNISMVYTIDSYRPIGGEVVVTQLGFKACFGFLLSFYTNPWIDRVGYSIAFGTMASITGAVLLAGIPFYFHGKTIRHASIRWRALRFVLWNKDRELGE